MEWWGWLLVGALSTGVVVLIIILLLRKPTVIGLSVEEKQKLASIAVVATEKELQAEQVKVKKLEEIAKSQKEQLAKLEAVYDEAKQTINTEKREEFEMYLGDANAAGDELDKLLGIGSEDPTPVRPGTRGEAGTTEEG